MNIKFSALVAAGCLLLGTSAAVNATSAATAQRALEFVGSANVSDFSSQMKDEKKKKKTKAIKKGDDAMGTGAAAPVPAGGAAGSASGTSGTDKKPGPPSSKTR